jgi:hypothetical protein
MMDIENYKQAIAWLRGNLAELQSTPGDPCVQLAVLHSFEVTYNLSEAILREAYVALGTDEYAAYVSLRELIWRASEDGIRLSSRKHWMRYGLALETMTEGFSLSADSSIADAGELLSRFADELESFANCVQRRLVSNG